MLLELQITSQGTVDHVKILQHTRYPLLELAAKEGFALLLFAPGTADRVRIPVTFSWHCAEYPKTDLTKAMEPTADRPYAHFFLLMNATRSARGGSSCSR